MKAANLEKKLSAIDFDRLDVATQKLNRMIIGNPKLAEVILRRYRKETGELMQVSRKAYEGVPMESAAKMLHLDRNGICKIPT